MPYKCLKQGCFCYDHATVEVKSHLGLYSIFTKISPLLKQQLETDVKILLEKANAALKKYKMHMVIANELLTRKEEVTLVTGNEKIHVRRDPKLVGDEVEKHIVKHIVEKHSAYVDNSDHKVSRASGS